MKVAFDAKRITQNTTGLGNYSRFVVNALSDTYCDEQWILFSPDKPQKAIQAELPQASNIHYHYPLSAGWPLVTDVWRSRTILRDLKAQQVDLYHGLSNEIPLGISTSGIPSVVTLHDLIFLRYPQFFKQIDRRIYHYKSRYACACSNRIIAVSETTKREIIRAFGVDEDKITVVYQACSESFREPVSDDKMQNVRQKFSLPSQYVLSVGSIVAGKNLLLTVKALKLSGLDIKLVVVGRKTSYWKQVQSYIREQHMEGQVIVLDQVSNSDLPAIYQLASLLVYPSLFEGFGIPVLEALNSGVPVIAGKGSSLEEAGGPHSIYVDPYNAAKLADFIRLLLTDSSLSKAMSIAGKSYAERFSAKRAATELMNIYTQLR